MDLGNGYSITTTPMPTMTSTLLNSIKSFTTISTNSSSSSSSNAAVTTSAPIATTMIVRADLARLTSVQYSSMSRSEQDMIVNVTREYPFDYATIMFGYIMPFVLVLTLFTNTLVVMVLAQRHMRTPTNIVLFTMAIVDLMTLLSPSPWYFYIYTLGYHDRFLHPPSACYAHHIMTDVIPVFFHTSSIWLALLLASQRYIYVCHPSLASTWCTVPRVRKAIFIILLVALLHQLTRFFDNSYESITIQYENRSHKACKNEISEWVHKLDVGLYFSTYFTFRILFVFIIPCVALITLNCLLFRALRRAKNKRTELLMKDCSTGNSYNRPSLRSCEYLSSGPISNYRTETTTLLGSAEGNENNFNNNNNQQNRNGTSRDATQSSNITQIGASSSLVVSGSNNVLSSVQQASLAPPQPQLSAVSSSASLRNLDSNRTTLMLIVVVTVFLMVEVPVAIVTILHVILNSFDIVMDVEYGQLNYIKLFTNFIIMISYSVNFTIYCSMSKKFRETFKDLFLFRKRARRRREQQQHQNREPETGYSARGRSIPMIIFI